MGGAQTAAFQLSLDRRPRPLRGTADRGPRPLRSSTDRGPRPLRSWTAADLGVCIERCEVALHAVSRRLCSQASPLPPTPPPIEVLQHLLNSGDSQAARVDAPEYVSMSASALLCYPSPSPKTQTNTYIYIYIRGAQNIIDIWFNKT